VSRPRRRLAALAAAALAAGCGGGSPTSPPPPPPQLAAPIRVSGASPYPAGCNPPVGAAVLFPGAEVEPHLAIDPGDPRHLVAAWQQDRWNGGGANGTGAAASLDGGRTWTRRDPAFTACAGGPAGAAWARTSDPWVAIGADGAVYVQALAFDNPWAGTRSAVVASRSTDGGLTWSAPATLALEGGTDLSLDKSTLTAHPTRPGEAYAVWDRLEGLDGPLSATRGPAWLTRTTDGGASWAPPWILYDPGADAQTIASQLVVLPDGALVDLLLVLRQLSAAAPAVEVAALRSVDAGDTWSGPFTVAEWRSAGVVDPAGGHPVRSGDLVPAVAVDATTGTLYAAWQDARFGGGVVEGIVLSRSLDGGRTWSAPARVNGDGAVPAFTPSLAVARSGRVGLGYYDWRAPPAGTGPGLWTTRWLATSADGGLTWTEEAAGGPFDLRRAPAVPGWFLGDYAGLVAGPDAFTSLFAMPPLGDPADPADAFAGPPQP
jgi:hypothetical protein